MLPAEPARAARGLSDHLDHLPPFRIPSSLIPARFRSRIRNQARHSGEVMRTVFGALRHAVRRHSSDVRMPSAAACRTAFFTVDRPTPASDATWLAVGAGLIAAVLWLVASLVKVRQQENVDWGEGGLMWTERGKTYSIGSTLLAAKA